MIQPHPNPPESDWPPPRTEMTDWDLRREFNEAGYFDVALGDFQPGITYFQLSHNAPNPDRPVRPGDQPLPPGTESFAWILYSAQDELIAIVHFDRLPPDGNIRGRPDPKIIAVRNNGTWWCH